MKLFYLKHHYLSIVRSKSFLGEVFATLIITYLLSKGLSLMFAKLDHLLVAFGEKLDDSASATSFFVVLFVLTDLLLKQFLKRPAPRLKYYTLLGSHEKSIARQYLITSLFGFLPLILFSSIFTIALKANEWLGTSGLIAVLSWALINHYLGLISQFGSKIFSRVILILALLIGIISYFMPSISLPELLLKPVLLLPFGVLGVGIAYMQVRTALERKEVIQKQMRPLFRFPSIQFTDPIFQLEYALVSRNKRTRSNVLMGLLSLVFLSYLITTDVGNQFAKVVFFITSGFFIIQHGVYSLGWEGGYFDFLLTNIKPTSFIRTRYKFYAMTCLVGALIVMIPVIVSGQGFFDLLMILLYNIGVTIPVVLYRSLFNRSKIELSENSFMNYDGMMTAPIFLTSFLVTVIPLIINDIGIRIFSDFGTLLQIDSLGILITGDSGTLLFGLLGIIGLLCYKPLTSLIAYRFRHKKYHLSQSFKS